MHNETNIKAQRLQFSPLMASHAEAMFPILSDRQLYRFTGDEPPESQILLEARYRQLESRKSPDGSQSWLNWLVSLKENDTAIGYIQATVSASQAEIAWVVGTKWQGNGYASEAAVALVGWLGVSGVTVVRACINPDHIASQRVASNAGLSKSSLLEDGEDVWVC
jgi:RimJ/RimL family protein N-acetyltransferase